MDFKLNNTEKKDLKRPHETFFRVFHKIIFYRFKKTNKFKSFIYLFKFFFHRNFGKSIFFFLYMFLLVGIDGAIIEKPKRSYQIFTLLKSKRLTP